MVLYWACSLGHGWNFDINLGLSLLVLSTLMISWILYDIAMLHLELAWIDWLQVLMDT